MASFSSHVHRVQQVIDIAAHHGRKVVFIGRSMVRNMKIAEDMGYLHVPADLVIDAKDLDLFRSFCERERCPFAVVGEATSERQLTLSDSKQAAGSDAASPIDMPMEVLLGKPPKMHRDVKSVAQEFKELDVTDADLAQSIAWVLQQPTVASKSFLITIGDRTVGGLNARDQFVGPWQVPVADCAVTMMDYKGYRGEAMSMGERTPLAVIDAPAAARMAVGEAVTNLLAADIANLQGVKLSANWMAACGAPGEDAKLYDSVKAIGMELCPALGISIPVGKDSLSMKQKYPNDEVIAPGTVIISAGGNCTDIRKVVEPVLQRDGGSIYYINLSQDDFKLGGSSFAQILNTIGNETPTIKDAAFFKKAFNTIQELILGDNILAGHDIGSGGLITTLLEMCFADVNLGAKIDFSVFEEKDIIKYLFAENIAVVFQAKEDSIVENKLKQNGVSFYKLGTATTEATLNFGPCQLDIAKYRDIWFKTSFLLDQKQAKNGTAKARFDNYKNQVLKYTFPTHFTGKAPVIDHSKPKPKAAIIREKGSNSEREMANAMYLAGFDVKDVHMTDLISGRETLEDIQFIGAVGGFSNSDVLGSAKGWAGAFLYNQKAKTALDNFFKREDTLSVGICNGCQLFMELELINPEHEIHGKMLHNDSHKHESIFTSVTIQENKSVMLSSLAGSTLGVWVSHGEGKFNLPMAEENYNIVSKYGYEGYPANPNGSDYNTAMLCDKTGRHLVMMPHIERSTFQWNWAHYPKDRNDEVSPWHEAFVNAKKWIDKH